MCVAVLCCPAQALVAVLAVVAVAAVLKNMYAVPKSPVYLVDFSVHKGLDEWRFSKDMFVPLSRETGVSAIQFGNAWDCWCWRMGCKGSFTGHGMGTAA